VRSLLGEQPKLSRELLVFALWLNLFEKMVWCVKIKVLPELSDGVGVFKRDSLCNNNSSFIVFVGIVASEIFRELGIMKF
jgi:hypothetical protein